MSYPTSICFECGNRFGKPSAGGAATFSIGTCDWCGAATLVTEPRDYGYPKAADRPSRPPVATGE